jgi:NAD(P)-dependent dehydrogenase (short-subunit alcohol dehydrogenase family)
VRLAGRVALVTGAQQGIGRAVALAFAREGADVAVNYRDDGAAAAAVVGAARACGVRALALPGDVARPPDVEAMAATVERELGRLDILVNNAGIFPRVPFLDMVERDWDAVLDVNLKGGFLCAQAAARMMVAGGRGGAIVNLASGAIRGTQRGVHYSASKGGVVSMTRALALELAPHGIRVNAIAPGVTDTAQPRYGHSEEELLAMAQTIPLGRLGTPDDIARVAVFLVSEEAGYMTGQTLFVNGGAYMP